MYDLNKIPYNDTMEVTNRFKGLDLTDGVFEELWMEVHDIVQETVAKTIPKKKECKKAKWLSEEAIQIAVKRREPKNKGEKERYTQFNAEFQKIARRDKKGFLMHETSARTWCTGKTQRDLVEREVGGGDQDGEYM